MPFSNLKEKLTGKSKKQASADDPTDPSWTHVAKDDSESARGSLDSDPYEILELSTGDIGDVQPCDAPCSNQPSTPDTTPSLPGKLQDSGEVSNMRKREAEGECDDPPSSSAGQNIDFSGARIRNSGGDLAVGSYNLNFINNYAGGGTHEKRHEDVLKRIVSFMFLFHTRLSDTPFRSGFLGLFWYRVLVWKSFISRAILVPDAISST
jgi:hypothetical protein